MDVEREQKTRMKKMIEGKEREDRERLGNSRRLAVQAAVRVRGWSPSDCKHPL